MKKISQFGRSMIEMLGVLAVIGILSVGTVNMYRNAMLRYRLGQTQQWFEMVRFITAEACANGNKIGCGIQVSFQKRADYVCAVGGKLICPKGKLKTPLKEENVLLYQTTKNYFLIYLYRLDKRTCEAVIDYDWNGLAGIDNYTNWTPSATVQSGNKYLTQEQKDRLKAACPYPMYMVLRFDFQN